MDDLPVFLTVKRASLLVVGPSGIGHTTEPIDQEGLIAQAELLPTGIKAYEKNNAQLIVRLPGKGQIANRALRR